MATAPISYSVIEIVSSDADDDEEGVASASLSFGREVELLRERQI